MGWRFLNSPRATLARETPIALITLNPGGSAERPEHARESSEVGSAYIVESWGSGNRPGQSPLQLQVRSLFGMLAAAQGGTSGDDLLHRSLAAYFVPFRSPSFEALAQPRESLTFASRLWERVFETIDPKLVITIDQRTTDRVIRILSEKLAGSPSTQQFLIGWGNYNADLASFASGRAARSVLRLPHLSRFRVFGRRQSEPYLRRIVEVAVGHLR